MTKFVVVGVGFPDVIQTIEDIYGDNTKSHFLGFIDDNSKFWGEEILGYPVLGDINWLVSNKIQVISTVGRDTKIRKIVYEKLLAVGATFCNLIHPTVNIKYANIGNGVLISKNTYIEPRVSIGSQCMVLPNTTIGHDSVIGDNSFVASGCHFGGYSLVGSECFIGSGAVIHPRVELGIGVTVGINANIVKSYPDHSTIIARPSTSI